MGVGSYVQGQGEGRKEGNEAGKETRNKSICLWFRKKTQSIVWSVGIPLISFVNHHIWKLLLRKEWGWGESENNLSGSSVSLGKSAPRAMNSPTLRGSSTQPTEKTQLPQLKPSQCLETVVSASQFRLCGPVVMTVVELYHPKMCQSKPGLFQPRTKAGT